MVSQLIIATSLFSLPYCLDSIFAGRILNANRTRMSAEIFVHWYPGTHCRDNIVRKKHDFIAVAAMADEPNTGHFFHPSFFTPTSSAPMLQVKDQAHRQAVLVYEFVPGEC